MSTKRNHKAGALWSGRKGPTLRLRGEVPELNRIGKSSYKTVASASTLLLSGTRAKPFDFPDEDDEENQGKSVAQTVLSFLGVDYDVDDASQVDDGKSRHGREIQQNASPCLHTLPIHKKDGGKEHRKDLNILKARALVIHPDIDGGGNHMIARRAGSRDEEGHRRGPVRPERVPIEANCEGHSHDDENQQ